MGSSFVCVLQALKMRISNTVIKTSKECRTFICLLPSSILQVDPKYFIFLISSIKIVTLAVDS